MVLSAGSDILRGRYKLFGSPVAEDSVSSTWIGIGLGSYDTEYLVKTWSFEDSSPDPFSRALWDAELRTMYRVGSSPGAEDTVLVIRDAGVDHEAGCFAMVFEAVGSNGYTTLSRCLNTRASHPWLTNHDLRDRPELWKGLQRISDGLQLLHDQNVLHRNVGVEGIYLNEHLGPKSFRLGGFEWSVRLGQTATGSPTRGWSTPPEHLSGDHPGFSHETDWYAFGILASRCVLNIEAYATEDIPDRHSRVCSAIDRATGKQISEIERSFLLRLLDPNPGNRLTRSFEIRTHIGEIIARLERGTGAGEDDRSLVLVINPQTSADLVETAYTYGFVPNPAEPRDLFNPGNPLHVANLTHYLQQDLSTSTLFAVPGKQFYVLAGVNLSLTLSPYNQTDMRSGNRTTTWELAYCNSTAELRQNPGGAACRQLPNNAVIVRTTRQIYQDPQLRQSAISWERYLPTVERAAELRASLSRFHEFIRCTNQLELLIRDAEIFAYEVVREESDSSKQRIHIKEIAREREPAPWCKIEGGLQEHLQREIDNGKPDSRLVILTGKHDDSLVIPRDIADQEHWTVLETNTIDGFILLERSCIGTTLALPANKGHIRTSGMFGQVSLIRRRKRAIDRLGRHAYLLRSLSAPGQVYMDTGEMPLLVPLAVNRVDEAKQAVMQDILRVRPIYALQGPPGTGKTTLVSHLIRQILTDDPVAQILITAPTHGAVDVLRSKASEAFQNVPQPLAVRLAGEEEAGTIQEGSVTDVSLKVLKQSVAALGFVESQSNLQKAWSETAERLVRALERGELVGGAGDFCELVRRGASVTYCTTSAGDLEQLADSSQSFDWAILEEAGKAHGFDLALPLQAGHRWLLIGDPNQLPPYRFDEYLKGLERLDEAVDWLFSLPLNSQRLVDVEWLRSWKEQDAISQIDFINFSKDWLNTFKRVLASCRTAVDGNERRTIVESNGSMAGLLSGQYRMHPTIGDLISFAFYKEELNNRTTENDLPRPDVVHPFVCPAGIQNKAIIWIDLPWAARERDYEEQGPRTGHPRFRNFQEVNAIKAFLDSLKVDESVDKPLSLAVLSPYNQQVSLIRNKLRGFQLPAFLTLKPNLSIRSGNAMDAERSLAHSVDSFQGNEADVIIVSLVRNNNLQQGDPSAIGFLKDAPRLNVLLSRAERLLVLVGSWEFFRKQFDYVPIEDTKQELWHWKKVITLLDDWFKKGTAIKIDGTKLGGNK